MQKIGNNGEPARAGDEPPVLVLEGALAPAGAALVRGGEPVACESLAGSGRRGAELFDLARRLVDHAGGAEALHAVVVGRGPGSYTGLRVALAIARGIAAARPGLLVRGIDAPRIVARAAGLELPALVAIRWGRLRVLLAEARADGTRTSATDLIPVEQLAARTELAGRPVAVLAGCEDWQFPAGVETRVAAIDPAAALARLAADSAGRLAALDPALPAYLVPPDAVLPESRSVAGRESPLLLGPGDAPEVFRLFSADAGYSWSRAMLADELAPDPARAAFGLRGPEGLEGAILLRWDDELMEVIHIAVDSAARRRGIGRRLLDAALARARELGLAQVDLEVAEGNEAALALYQGAGFVPVGRRPRYYPRGQDAVLLSLRLRR